SQHVAARLHELAAERSDLLGPRRQRVTCRETAADAAERRVALRERSSVIGGQLGACRRQATERPVEVRTTHGGAAPDDGETVRRENERGDLGAQLLRRTQRRTVQLRALSLAHLKRQLQLDRGIAALSAERDATRALAEPHELRVHPRAW